MIDWEKVLSGLIASVNPQVILAIMALTEIIKRSVWEMHGLSRAYLLYVPLALAPPLVWMWGLGITDLKAFSRQSLICGLAANLLYHSFEKKLKVWTNKNGEDR